VPASAISMTTPARLAWRHATPPPTCIGLKRRSPPGRLFCAPARIVPSAKGRWDGVNGDDHHGGRVKASRPQSRKDIAAGPIPPRARNGTTQRTMGVVSDDVGIGEKILVSGPLPPARRRIVPSVQGRGGGGLTGANASRYDAEKIVMITMAVRSRYRHQPKKYRCRSSTPRGGRGT
jgi:hypothetical protein